MGRLHRIRYYTRQFLGQRLQISLVPRLGREGLKGLLRVVLAAVEVADNEVLDTLPQRPLVHRNVE